MDVCSIIKKRREELGLTYEELGKKVGVGKSTVRKWEIGAIENMRRDSIVALAKALDISPAVIMGWNTKEEAITLSNNEKQLLENYNKLNDLGKKEANKRVSELTEISKYTLDIKTYEEPITIAAHNDNVENKEEQIKKVTELFKDMDK